MSDSQQWTLSDLRAWSTDRLSSVLSTITTGLTATYDGRWVYSHDLQLELNRRHPTNDELAAVAHGAYFDGDWAEVSKIERDLWRNVVKAIFGRAETSTTPFLPTDLAALLARHNVPPTVDGLLAEFERRKKRLQIDGPDYDLRDDPAAWKVDVFSCGVKADMRTFNGPTLLHALANAFQAMVEGSEER